MRLHEGMDGVRNAGFGGNERLAYNLQNYVQDLLEVSVIEPLPRAQIHIQDGMS